MKQEYIWHLIALKLSGEASEEDIMVLNKLQDDFPQIDYYVQILSALWQTEHVSQEVINSSIEKLQKRIEKEKFNYN